MSRVKRSAVQDYVPHDFHASFYLRIMRKWAGGPVWYNHSYYGTKREDQDEQTALNKSWDQWEAIRNTVKARCKCKSGDQPEHAVCWQRRDVICTHCPRRDHYGRTTCSTCEPAEWPCAIVEALREELDHAS